ncbi:hypothetical protein [Paenirhodobacter sp.]|uniref:hypothetical protein n=1 Tax=Paenirhodobacter sp. TaxID=1965326 RepID=UPI003B40D120
MKLTSLQLSMPTPLVARGATISAAGIRSLLSQPDPEADEAVEKVAENLRNLWRISELLGIDDLQPGRVFKACLRLIAKGDL